VAKTYFFTLEPLASLDLELEQLVQQQELRQEQRCQTKYQG
jgi:hypothetical protein